MSQYFKLTADPDQRDMEIISAQILVESDDSSREGAWLHSTALSLTPLSVHYR